MVHENCISQIEADQLLKMAKQFKDPYKIAIPVSGEKNSYSVISEDGREEFALDIYTGGKINLVRHTNNFRYAKVIILARIDLNGGRHINPDGTVIFGHHLHLYKEGYGDRWAYALPDKYFTTPDDSDRTFYDFLRYVNIINIDQLKIQGVLFDAGYSG